MGSGVKIYTAVIVACLAGAWLVKRQHIIATVKEETSEVERRITAIRMEVPGAPAAEPGSSDSPQDESAAGFDWEAMLLWRQGGGTEREKIALREAIDGMSGEEIILALEQIAALGLGEGEKDYLAGWFFNPLASKNPQAALHFFGKRAYRDIGTAMVLAKALGKWAESEPSAACAWVDQWIAGDESKDKSLSDVNDGRVRFERELARVLFFSDPQVLEERLLKMNAEEALHLLSSLGADRLDAKDHAAFADMARKTLPEDGKLKALSRVAETLSQDLEQVSGYLQRIGATPAEEAACVQAAAAENIKKFSSEHPLTIEELDRVREWIGTAESVSTGGITGAVLGEALYWNRMSFEEAAALVMHYRQEDASDEGVVDFLKRGGCCHGQGSMELAERIADPALRENAIRHIRNH